MTQQEAISVLEQWIQEHSFFAAHVVNAILDAEGSWRVQAECSEAIWWQKVNNAGEVGEPEIID